MISRFVKKVGLSRLLGAAANKNKNKKDTKDRPLLSLVDTVLDCDSDSDDGSNDESTNALLEIHLKKTSDMSKLIKRLKNGDCHGVKRILISISPTGIPSRHWKLPKLFSLLGSILELEEVIFRPTTTSSATTGKTAVFILPIGAVTLLLQRSAPSLRTLTFDRCTLSAAPSALVVPEQQQDGSERVARLWNCIGRLPNLESLEINACWLDLGNGGSGGTTTTTKEQRKQCPCSLLIEGASSLPPKLKRFVARSPPRGGLPPHLKTKHILRLLSGCPRLEELDLKDAVVSKWNHLVPVLNRQPNLCRLILGDCNMTAKGTKALGEWLSSNPPLLQDLELSPIFGSSNRRHRIPDGDGGDDGWDDFTKMIPQAICCNTHLTRFVLQPSRHNTTQTCVIPYDVQASWLAMIKEHNLVLQTFEIVLDLESFGSPIPSTRSGGVVHYYCEPSLQSELEYYVRLNKLGRKWIEQSCDGTLSANKIVQTLENANDDVSCMYYLLQTNLPIVCQAL